LGSVGLSSYPTCPDPKKIADMLREKHRLAEKAFRIELTDRGWRMVTVMDVLVSKAHDMFGELQTIDESLPPPRNAYKAIIESVPGLLACLHKAYYEQGILKNEVLTIEGPGGIGKTSYVWYLTLFVGGRLVNDARSFLETFRELVYGNKWVPVLVLDDIASIISKYWFMIREERSWAHFFKMIEYAKDWAGVIIATARSFEGVARRLRELSSLRGTYTRAVLPGGLILDYIVWKKPGHKLPYYVDILWPGLRVPEQVWGRIMRVRRSRAERLLSKLEEAIKQLEPEEFEEGAENE